MKMFLTQKLWIGSWRYLSWVLPRQTALWAEDLFLTPSRVVAHSFGAGCSVLAVRRGMKAEKLVLVAGPSRYELVIKNYLKMIGLSSLSQKHFLRSLESKVGLPASEMNVGRLGQGLGIPALIVHDEEDREVRYKAALEIHETWPETELLATQGLGHRRILKDPVVTF